MQRKLASFERGVRVVSEYSGRYASWIIIALGTALRFYKLAEPDFWYDEAFTGVALKERFSDMLVMIDKDVHPPLYYFAAKVFSEPFGYSVFGIRLFSLIFGVLGIWGIYLFAKELIDRKTALYAALIVAVSPFAVQYSQEARMYAMLSCLLVFAAYFFIRGIKTGKRTYFAAWGVLLGISFLTHYLAIVFSPLFYAVAIVRRMSQNPGWYRTRSGLMKPFVGDWNILLGYVLSVLVFSPWITKFVGHITASDLDWIKPAKLSDIFLNLQIFLVGIPRGRYAGMPSPSVVAGFDNSTMYLLLAVFVVFVVIRVWRIDRQATSVLLVLSLGFMLILVGLSIVGEHYLVARYVIPAAYFLYILLGFWLSRLSLRKSTVALSTYVLILLLITPPGYSTGYNQIFANLSKYDGKTIYVLNSFDYVIAKYYFGPDRLVLFNIDWPQYDSSIWAAIGGARFRKVVDFDVLKNDPNGIIIYNTKVDYANRSDKSFNPTRFPIFDAYDNMSVYRSVPK
ncbi:MAG TPA: glycosyltransferase family 39 protein [Candidatus Fimivivens sp.]|nr:glycosyltransferase family 39 protein [Candidatus Fimivivens sp.]